MFRLVGSEVFHIGKKGKVAEITISSKGMSFEYALTVDGKPLEKFVQAQAKNTRTWLPNINGTNHRIVLGKDGSVMSALFSVFRRFFYFYFFYDIPLLLDFEIQLDKCYFIVTKIL